MRVIDFFRYVFILSKVPDGGVWEPLIMTPAVNGLDSLSARAHLRVRFYSLVEDRKLEDVNRTLGNGR